ncbi:hypothetical protein BDZ89DRAFT_323204 [Hymenopellis radicata]|nr:hypothetical protein BDZ89DRAFT_323204 [Hymenopellis radicata]
MSGFSLRYKAIHNDRMFVCCPGGPSSLFLVFLLPWWWAEASPWWCFPVTLSLNCPGGVKRNVAMLSKSFLAFALVACQMVMVNVCAAPLGSGVAVRSAGLLLRRALMVLLIVRRIPQARTTLQRLRTTLPKLRTAPQMTRQTTRTEQRTPRMEPVKVMTIPVMTRKTKPKLPAMARTIVKRVRMMTKGKMRVRTAAMMRRTG